MKRLNNWTFPVVVFTIFSLVACNGDAGNTTREDHEVDQHELTQEEEETASSRLGAFEALVGKWTIDAATAGVQLDLTFGEDGSFRQQMGEMDASGTWSVKDDTNILVETENTTEPHVWEVTDLTAGSVNISWNPDSPQKKVLPMQRAD